MGPLKTVITALTSTVIMLAACRHHPEFIQVTDTGGTTPTPWVNPDPCDQDSIYFANTIAPLLNAYCGSEDCHDNVNPEEGINVTSYAHIMNSDDGEFVVPYDLGESKLWESLHEPMSEDEHMPPSDNPQLSADQMDLISQWINQGAPNNACTADCDTSLVVTYASVIQPMMQNNCVGCHGSSNPSGDLSLTTYAEVVTSANGSLMDALNGTNGEVIMPDGTTGLPQCMIDQVQEWIDAGMPE